MRQSADIETALYNLLTADGYSASAHEIPEDLGDTSPHIHVVRTSGYEQSFIIEVNQVDFDVYAEDSADAMETASELCGWVRELAGATDEMTCYQAEVTTLPYGNPDPRHPNIGRATFSAQIYTRMKEVN